MTLRVSRLAVLVVIAVQLALCYHGAQVLPERVASHFDFSGRPDGWTSRVLFLVLFAGLAGLTALLGIGLPALLRTLPTGLINMPHKEYWLAPERKAETLVRLGDDLAWIAFLTGALMAALLWRTIEFNLDPEGGAMSGALWLTAGYLLAVAVWTARILLRFRRPAGA